MKTVWLALLVLACVLSVTGQKPTAPRVPQVTSEAGLEKVGAITNGLFQSKTHGLTLIVPSELTVVSTAEYSVLNRGGLDLIKAEGGKAKEIEAAENRARSLIVIAAKPVGSPLNSALEISAAHQQRGVTANMVLSENVKVFKGGAYTLLRSFGNLKVGANAYAAADFELTIGATKLYQRMYIVMHKGYSVVIVNTYHDDEQRDELEAVLAKVVFTK